MSPNDTVQIKEIAAFPDKIAAIREAAAQLRAAAAALSQIPDTASREASSFTRDGNPAPVYGPLLSEVAKWTSALNSAAGSVCDSAENAAATAAHKFNGIITTDEKAKAVIAGMGSDAVSVIPVSTGSGSDSFSELQKEIGAKAGLAYMPLFGDNRSVTSFGDLKEGDAWSTIKAPIALAAMRENGGVLTDDITAALTRSDNTAADRLWSSLGDPQTAAEKVQNVLRDSGDTATVVNTETPPKVGGFQPSSYGQTQWSLENQLRFMSHLSQDPNGTQILNAMSNVTADQQWGLGQLDGSQFKGGWGPEGDGMTRQMGIVDGPGGKYAVAMMADPESGSHQVGQNAMNRVSQWLDLK